MRAIVSLALAAAMIAALLVSGQEDTVRTDRPNPKPLPLPSGEGVFHFAIYGDRTGGPAEGVRVLAQAVRDTNLLAPDLVMTVGDLVQGYNERPLWLDEMHEFRGIMDGLAMPWFPVAGNHDTYWRGGEAPPEGEHEGDYEKHFGPLWYWFPHKNAAFFVLYSDEGDPETGRKAYDSPEVNRFSEAQLTWLREELPKAKDKDHVFVFLHHPKWMERYPGSNWDDVHDILVGAGNVSAVFAGHIHRLHYAGRRDEIEYFSLATTGGGIGFDVPYTGSAHHLNMVTVRGDSYEVATIPTGQVWDHRDFTDERWAITDALTSENLELRSEPVMWRTKSGAEGSMTFELRNPSEKPIEVDIVADPGATAWSLSPVRRTARIEAGASQSFEWTARYPADRDLDWDLPSISTDSVLIDGERRCPMPRKERVMPLAMDLTAVQGGAEISNALALGRRDCVAVASELASVPDGPLTLEAWMKVEGYGGRKALVTKTESSEYGLFVSDGQPGFSIHLNGRYVAAEGEKGSLPEGRWVHVAGVFDGQEVRLYVDGQKVASQAGSGARTRNDHPLYVGADPDWAGRPVSFLGGTVDEIRLSTVARYEGASFSPSEQFEHDAETVLLLHCDRFVGPFLPNAGSRGEQPRTIGRPKLVSRGSTGD
ncbi:MAG: LamG-like jellyroll fold domain-containing protein [Planctomycetota bacterium]